MMYRILFAFVLVAILLAAQANQAMSFRCIKKRTVSEELAQAVSVFSGEAIAQEYKSKRKTNSDSSEDGEVLVVKFKVERWWKGSGADEIEMHTSQEKQPDGTLSLMAEDFHFQTGESYLVYAFWRDAYLTTNQCQRTAKLEQAKEDLLELGEGRIPSKRDN
jgi:hypothetical protein